MKKLIFLAIFGNLLPFYVFSPSAVFAEEVKFEANDSASIKSNLEAFVGKTVELKLASGGEIAGVVASVGREVVHLQALTGKEFYDAVVRIDQISAVVARVKR